MCAGTLLDYDTAANSADKSQSFEIKIEDITEHDDKPRPYLCIVCDRRFSTQYSLNRHKRIHSVDYLYSCNECEKSYSCLRTLTHHKNIHTGKYKCTECGECCQSSSRRLG